jgi:hypothetical protein
VAAARRAAEHTPPHVALFVQLLEDGEEEARSGTASTRAGYDFPDCKNHFSNSKEKTVNC